MRTVVWQSLSEAQQESILERPAITEGANITAAVAQVIAKVRSEGDAALFELTEKFDRVNPLHCAYLAKRWMPRPRVCRKQ